MPMFDTPQHIIFPKKVIFREMIQEYDGEILFKDNEAVKNAKFEKNPLPFFNDHDISKPPIGDIRNLVFDYDKWRGDVYFQKDKLTEDQKYLLLTGQKKDLSIGFEYTLVPTPDAPSFDGKQTDISVSHVAWVDEGRCPTPYCGLDQLYQKQQAQDQQNNKRLKEIEVFPLVTECDELKLRNSELEAQLKAVDSAEKDDLTKQIKTLTEKITGADEALKTQVTDFETKEAESTKKFDELETQFKEKVKALDAYEKTERDSLVKAILKTTQYKEDDLKDMTLAEVLKEKGRIDKINPKIITGYPAGQDGGEVGEDELPQTSLTEQTDIAAMARAHKAAAK